jgi:hypothetical protein
MEGPTTYDPLTGRSGRDPNQGFFYKHPQTGERMFQIPLAGRALGFLSQMGPGGFAPNLGGDQEIAVSLQNLNFAAPGNILPGVGPSVSLPAKVLGLDDPTGELGKVLYPVMYPYGAPEDAGSELVPGWGQRLLAGLGLAFQDNYESQMADVMNTLAASGDYGDPNNPQGLDQQRLIDDAKALNANMSLWRGIFQASMPASPRPEFFTTDTNGSRIAMTQLTNAYQQMLEDNPDNQGAAVQEFVEKFGVQNILALAPKSQGSGTLTTQAWSFVQDNPGKAKEYEPVLGYLYPGGEFSFDYFRWQQAQGSRRTMGAEERAEWADRLVYLAARSQIDVRQAENGFSDEWAAEQKDALKASWGGEIPTLPIDTNRAENKLALLRKAVDDKAFKSSPVYGATVKYLQARDNALAWVKEQRGDDRATFMNDEGRQAAAELESFAADLRAKNPQFSKVFYGVFASEIRE